MCEIKDIENAINELQKGLKFPNCNLKLSKKYDLLHADYNKDPYPNCEDPGVYLLLDEEERVLYIGKASCKNTLGERIGSYFKKDPEDSNRGLAKDRDFEKVRYIVTIPLRDHAFVAPLVEEYFLYHSTAIQPRLNTNKGESK